MIIHTNPEVAEAMHAQGAPLQAASTLKLFIEAQARDMTMRYIDLLLMHYNTAENPPKFSTK